MGGKTAASLGTKACPGLRSGIRGTSQTDESRSFRSSTICYPCARSVPAISLSPWERAGVRVKAGIGARGTTTFHGTSHEQTRLHHRPPHSSCRPPNRHSGEGRNPEGRWEARPPPVLPRIPDSDPGYVAPVKLMSPGRSDLLPSVTHVPGLYRRSPSPLGRGPG